jgi:hypothetical protein
MFFKWKKKYMFLKQKFELHHIGIENLKNFYIKNGFEIRENSIFKLIKNVEEKIEY